MRALNIDQTVNVDPLAVTPKDACRILGVGRTTLYEEMKANRVKAVKAGRRTLVLVESLREWLGTLPDARAA